MYHDFFVHSSVDGHLGCFHALTIVNSAAVDNGMHVSFSILVSSAYRQRFITTKKCDWGKKELKSLIRFHRANKMDNEEGGRKDKSKRIYRTSQSIKNSKCFSWVTAVRILSFAGSHSPPRLPRMPSNTADLWTCCGGSSDSNLVLLLCVLASNVCSHQNQCFFLCGSSQCPFIYSMDPESA